jgi:aryl-alcohol dehydrogenase-like predicted oxidoreductase
MKTRRLGRSGLIVSEVGLGCNNFGMRIDQAGADAVVGAALDAGVTFFDTADMYGGGQSEPILGRALGKRRKDVIVATKFGLQMGENPLDQGRGRRWIMRAVEDSLTRLGTDYIDLYQAHWPDPETPLDESLRALDDLVTQGKVRYIGSSNLMGWEIAESEWIARTSGRTRFISAQNKLSILDQGALAEVVPACAHYGVGFLPYFPLASGLLSGKYRKGEAPGADTRFGALGAGFGDGLTDARLAVAETLADWAEARGHSLLELAFAWLLGHPAVGSVIAGATKPEQVTANVAAGGWTLTPEEVQEVGRIGRGE